MSAPAASSPSRSANHAPPNPPVPETLGTTSSAHPNNATALSNPLTSPILSPSLQSSSSRPQPSNSGSASRSATSPPTTTTATATASAATGSQPRVTMDLNPTLPSRATQLHIDEARAALVASMSNMLDSELQSRASLLHSNAAALTKQEKDVAKGTEALRKENDKLEKLARDTERKIKELGNVQNWAEVLERDFLVLEETMRIVREGSGSGDDSCSKCSGSSWTGSYSADDSRAGSRRGSVTGDADGNVKKPEERGLNGHTAVDAAVESGKLEDRNDINVTVDKAVAESILEAMATDLHEPLGSLSLNPVSSESQGSSLKGKEPAVNDSGIEVDNAHDVLETREPVQPPDTNSAGAVEDVVLNNDLTHPATTDGKS
ncbi:uncharacterized protein F4807DRAFT_68462 [Annulohypoxylon truncatum]|uniref:uncharacterized protein n=1 Tax=Annulohypoxylon truncatum TaxID=327061 RepID=UPI0020081F97|nr:uncharacterized protein F4807DRAFT_68462 [Annulohypoxylon truncatum]KAI1210494.1 hypothetical protein F4807DRAFT_68462 [Annulohypoxylon truncatum]